MASYKCYSFLVVLTLLDVYRGQGIYESSYPETSAQYYYKLNQDGTPSNVAGPDTEPSYVLEFSEYCQQLECQRFRTFNGTCNHPKNYGASYTALGRLLAPDYEDNVSSPRQFGVDGYPLSSARNVTLHVHPAENVRGIFTLMLPAWGQFVDHDIVSVLSKEGVKCCGPNGQDLSKYSDPDCYPIELPADEYAFPGHCMDFVRSVAATDRYGVPLNAVDIGNESNDCRDESAMAHIVVVDATEPRQQINEVTSFLDASHIYGPTDKVAESLRDGPFLRTKDGYYLPEDVKSKCNKRRSTGDYCFLAGDQRVNQHPYLSTLHTVFLREHNQIAAELRTRLPYAPDIEVFQLARRIVIALIQSITYNKYLPIILGTEAERYNLISKYGRSFYSPGFNPRIFIAFSSAAFRFGHSMIPSYIPIGKRLVLLRYLFNSPGEVYYNFDEVVSGMTGITGSPQNAYQVVDRNFAEDLSRYLFLNTSTGRGLDLISTNIQRGREHGVKPYVQWRRFCGLRPITGFNDTEALGPHAPELARVYRSPEDIDLFTGAIHEPPVKGALVGPTIQCLVAMQFSRLKFGDRHFFDNSEKASAFSDAQLSALRNTTLSKVLCRNTNLDSLPLDVFSYPSATNPLIPCKQLISEGLNLMLFA